MDEDHLIGLISNQMCETILPLVHPISDQICETNNLMHRISNQMSKTTT